MSHTTSPSVQRPYGVVRVCQEWGMRRSTFYHQQHRAEGPPAEPAKRGPKTSHTDEMLTAHIRQVLAASPFLGEGHRKVWARLRAQGIRTSKPRVLRLMRQASLLAPNGVQRVLGPRAHDGTITTERPNQMWGTDATSTVTQQDGPVTVFVGVDHCTLEGIGIHATRRATRFEALEPIRQGIRQQFGTFSAGIVTDVQVRHDHGSQYMSEAFQAELRFLGSHRVRRSYAPRKATVSRNGSFGRSRNSCCGCERSRPWRTSVAHSTTGCVSIMSSGSSNGMGSVHQLRCGETS